MFVEFTRKSGSPVAVNAAQVLNVRPSAEGEGTAIAVPGEYFVVTENYSDVVAQLNIASDHLTDTLRMVLQR